MLENFPYKHLRIVYATEYVMKVPYDRKRTVNLIFLLQVLGVLLDDIPLNIRQDMWFQHDGVSSSLGRCGPITWPPDLNPTYFLLRGRKKSLIDETPAETEEEFLARVVELWSLHNKLKRHHVWWRKFVGGRRIEPELWWMRMLTTR